MNPIDVCRFCNIIREKYQYDEIDQPFAHSNEYIAIASIGAMIEGWSLVVPKRHELSMKRNYGNREFSSFIENVIPKLITKYGRLIAFEHGSNKEGSITACGTNHAHLHLVPFNETLIPDLNRSGLHWVQCHASDIFSLTGDKEYLFYTEINNGWNNPVGYLHVLEFPISQYFRHLLATKCNCSETSDYRRFPYLDTAKQTRRALVAVDL